VCDTRAVQIQQKLIVLVKFALFGLICSLSTYLVVTATKTKPVQTRERKRETKTAPAVEISILANLASQNLEPQPLETKNLAVSPNSSMDLLPELEKADEALEEKILDTEVETAREVLEKEDGEMVKQLCGDENIPPTLNFRDDIIDFEDYKKSVDRGHTRVFGRPRSFSEPKGAERFIRAERNIPYPFTIENARQSFIGERSPPREPVPVPFEEVEVNTPITEDYPEPGSPARNQLDMIDEVALEVPGQHTVVSQSTPPEQKVNERKPMVFVGGVSASTSALELVSELKRQGFNVTVVPRIRYGVSFGFCPDLVLSSEVEVEKLLSLGRVWVKDRWVDIRPYIPKDDDAADGHDQAPESRVVREPTAIGNVQFLSYEDIHNDPVSPAQKQPETFDPTMGGQSPPIPGSPQHQYVPINPFYQMAAPVIPFSPGHYPPHMIPHFFPQHFQQEYMVSPEMAPKRSAPQAVDVRTLDQHNYSQTLNDGNFQASANTSGGDPAPFYSYASK